jgi:hypothetical protein
VKSLPEQAGISNNLKRNFNKLSVRKYFKVGGAKCSTIFIDLPQKKSPMQRLILLFSGLFLFFPLFAGDVALPGSQDEKTFIQYLAGIELIDRSSNLSDIEIAEKYRELTRITGLNADSVKTRILRLKDKPEQWHKVRTKVLELLQKLQ